MGAYGRVMDELRSPIEKLFLSALYESDHWYDGDESDTEDAVCVLVERGGNDEPSNRLGYVRAQMPCGRYSIDFAVVGPGGLRVAIELDGHEFHEKTKEQVAADKARERVLVKNGWRVIRFSGSDVHRDVAARIREVIEVCLHLRLEHG